MPIYPGPNIAIFTTYFTASEGPAWSNTTYWEAASTQITNANAVAAATSYHTSFTNVVAPLMAQSCKAVSTKVRVFLSGSLVEGEVATEVEGTATSTESLPRQDCVVIQKKTGQFGRSNAGRLFLSGISEDVQVNGEIANSYRPTAKAVATWLGADKTFSVPFHSRHWNRKLNTFPPITAAFAVIELKSRRDRQWFKGSTKI